MAERLFDVKEVIGSSPIPPTLRLTSLAQCLRHKSEEKYPELVEGLLYKSLKQNYGHKNR